MKVLFNVNPKVAGVTPQGAYKVQSTGTAQEQASLAPTSFKGSEAAKSILQAQENMRVPKGVMGVISFKGNPAKHDNQIVSIASEYQNFDKPIRDMYSIGGLACVAGEAADAFKKEGMDLRTFIPYHSRYTDKEGKRVGADGKIFVHYKEDNVDKFRKESTDYELEPGEDFALVAGTYKGTEKVKDKETNEVKEVPATPKWLKLTRTNISGSMPYLDEVDSKFEQKEDKYTLFKLEQPVNEGEGEKPEVYVLHTEGLANLTKAYGGEDSDAYFSNFDREYSNYTRAIVGKILPEMSKEENKEEFKDFNPAGYWLHDRFAFPAMLEASKRAADGDDYFSGLRMHATYHNPGRGYQGHYDNPLDFIKTIGAVEILDTLAQDKPEEAKRVVNYIKRVSGFKSKAKGNDKFASIDKILTKDEYKDLETIFEPYIGQFKDQEGSYNMSLIPHAAIGTNKGNFTHGTVSMNYGKEMINHETPNIALGLTDILAEDKENMINITNGSSADNLKLYEPKFPTPCMAEKVGEFTPLVKKEIDAAEAPAEALSNAKKSNAKWLINGFGEVFKKADEAADKVTGEEEAAKVAEALGGKVSKEEIAKAKEEKIKEVKEQARQKVLMESLIEPNFRNDKVKILGAMSEYQEGDKLFVGWGRPDSQKGMPISLEAFKQFFEDESISEDKKMHTKVILGAGPWDDDNREWQKIQKTMEEIAKIDDGKYAKNVMYISGRTTNKIVACADYSILTSRYEPCGITPLESYAGGTPVISIATGGAPDFVKPNETGFLTKHAFFTNPDALEKDTGIKMKEPEIDKGKQTEDEIKEAKELAVDDYRIEVLGKEAKDCINEALDLDDAKYKEMAYNCYNQKIGWDENTEYNEGKTANQRYFEDAFGVEKTENGFVETSGDSHPTNKLNYVTGDIKPIDGENGRKEGSFETLRKEEFAKDDKGTDGPKGLTTIQKVGIGAGIAGAVAVIGLAIKKFFGGKDKKAKKAGAKKVTPKAPKPAAAKVETKVETPAAPQAQAKPNANDFAKYLK